MFQDAFATFERKIKAAEFCITFLELVDHTQRLQIVLEAP